MALFADMATGNLGVTPRCSKPPAATTAPTFVSDGSKQDAVRKLLEGN